MGEHFQFQYNKVKFMKMKAALYLLNYFFKHTESFDLITKYK